MTLPVFEFKKGQVSSQLCYLLTEGKAFSQLDLLKKYSNDTKIPIFFPFTQPKRSGCNMQKLKVNI